METYEPTAARTPRAAQRIARRRLSAKLRPLLLRRLKKHVAKDLPDRIEQRRDCQLGDEQRKLYLAELRRSREQVMQDRGRAGPQQEQDARAGRPHPAAPDLLPPASSSATTPPRGKTETLFELLDPLVAEGQKVLVFSQFVQMLQLLEKECRAAPDPHPHPHRPDQGPAGGRQRLPGRSQPGVFLLSLRAAGTGLNLTTASYVVLYDPWWNPAVEAQAIDRSHRIGQTQTVNAYRLIAPGTVEEKIWELQQSKAQTIADVLGEEGFARSLSKTDLEYLFAED